MIESHTTCKDEKEAKKIADILLSKKLAACINYFPVKSIYYWKGRIEKDSETMLIIKSEEKKEKELINTIKKNHSYKLPVITVHKVKTTKDVEKWIKNSTT